MLAHLLAQFHSQQCKIYLLHNNLLELRWRRCADAMRDLYLFDGEVLQIFVAVTHVDKHVWPMAKYGVPQLQLWTASYILPVTLGRNTGNFVFVQIRQL